MALMCRNGVNECTGCQMCYDQLVRECPVCGEFNPYYFYRMGGEIIGCEFCIERVEAV